jgi:hypothetical protein
MAPTLTRTTLGRLASYGAVVIPDVRAAFNAAEWTASGSAGGVSVVSNNLRVNTTSPNGFVWGRLTTVDSADGYVQANWSGRLRTTDRGGILARHVGSPLDAMRFGSNGGTAQILQEIIGGAQVQAASASIAIASPSRLHMKVSGTTAAGKKFGTAEGALTGLTLVAAGGFGLMDFNNSINTSSYCDYSEFYACRGHLLSVVSDSDGWYMRVKNAGGTVLATSANASGGSASIDIYGSELTLPLLVTLEVLDVATDALLATVTPTETLWGGDVWTLAFPSDYPASRLAHRKAGAQRLLLKR